MRVADVRKRYPEFFVTVEAAVWYDMGEAFRKTCRPDDKVLRRVCYNAAAVATLELHKIARRKEIKVAGKTSANKPSTKYCSPDFHRACRKAGCVECPHCRVKV
jgi:hypothetical protein